MRGRRSYTNMWTPPPSPKGPWYNGNTSVSKTEDPGSIPGGPVYLKKGEDYVRCIYDHRQWLGSG